MIFTPQSPSAGYNRGRVGRLGNRLLSMLTKRTTSAPDGWPQNGSLAASFRTSCALTTMISHLNESFPATAARTVDSLTFSRTTNVPTAPMLTKPYFASCFATSAGRHRLVVPTLTARRKTTHFTEGLSID